MHRPGDIVNDMVNQLPAVDTTFSVLADPTRRAIVAMLAERPRPAGELAAAFPVSKPAISRHLRLLREGELIEEQRIAADGRVRMYALRREPFQQLDDWLDGVRRFWDDQLASFRRYVESEQAGHPGRSGGGDDQPRPAQPDKEVPR
jgi:DNA-binding transcriptional ArsR family regulator